MKIKLLLALVLGISAAAILGAQSQQTGYVTTQNIRVNGSNRIEVANGFAAYTPTDLGASAITLPASGSTASTTIVDMRGVTEATLQWVCNQAAKVNITTYADDGTTSEVSSNLTTATAAANQVTDTYLGSESAASSQSVGTAIATAPYRLPQRAVSFSWTNGGATAGSCTARLFLAY
jgi:hypothetical protein